MNMQTYTINTIKQDVDFCKMSSNADKEQSISKNTNIQMEK